VSNSSNNLNWSVKGIMLDSARLTENYEFYENIIPRLAKWGYNTLFAHFCDDEGCSILLENTEVLPAPGAFTVSQWKALIELANNNGIMVIPEVECLGHTGYITRLGQYKELREPPLDGAFWSINPDHPKSLKLIKGIIEEVDGIFNSPYIHIGMDEADIGGSETSQKVLKTKPKWQLFGEYLNSVYEIVLELGKKSMCWGDHLLSEEALADFVNKDVIICNWLYGYDYSENYKENSRYLLDKGFSVLGCPAGVWNGTLYAPTKDNFENLHGYTQAMVELSAEYPDKILGMVNTFWNAYRHLPSVLLPSVFYGAGLFNGKYKDFTNLLWINYFVENEFGLDKKDSEIVAKALQLLLIERRRTRYEVAMKPYDNDSLVYAYDKIVRFTAETMLKLADKAKVLLVANASKVKKKKEEYEQWISTAKMIIEVSSLGEFYHKLSPAAANGNRRRKKSSKLELNNIQTIVNAGKEDLAEVLTFWKNENKKYRNNLGTRYEQKGQDTVFWEVKDSDHPIERLELTVEFLSGLN